MLGEAYSFGDVFKYNDNHYIFLTSTTEATYCAKILDKRTSKELDSFYTRNLRKNKNTTDKPIYCYTVLTTENFKEQAAFFGQPEIPGIVTNKYCQLDKKDLKEIKKDILENDRAIPKGLREAVINIEIME